MATTDRKLFCSKTSNFAWNFTPEKRILENLTGDINATNIKYRSKNICSLKHLSLSSIWVTRSLGKFFYKSLVDGAPPDSSWVNKAICNRLQNPFTAGKKLNLLFAGLGSVRMAETCSFQIVTDRDRRQDWSPHWWKLWPWISGIELLRVFF